MSIKVIQWGTGYTGSSALRYLINNPASELVGVKCVTDAKDGVDAGQIAGLAPIGVTATRDTDALLATDADIVVHMPRDLLADPSVPGSPVRNGTRSCSPSSEEAGGVRADPDRADVAVPGA